MRGLIRFVMTMTVLFVFVLAGVAGLVYKFRSEKLPYQARIQSMFELVTLGDTTAADTLLTDEQRRYLEDTARRDMLDIRETDVVQQEADLKLQLDSLGGIQQDISRLIAQREQLQNERLQKLAAVYEQMRPEVAAPIIQELPDITIASLFTRMKERQAARIMGELPPDRAAEIARRMGQVQ